MTRMVHRTVYGCMGRVESGMITFVITALMTYLYHIAISASLYQVRLSLLNTLFFYDFKD